MLRRKLEFVFAMAVAIVCAMVITTIRLWPRPALSAQIASSTAVFDRNGRLLRLTLATDEQYRLWTPLEEVAPQFIDALLLHEDQQFYRHLGVNPVALVRAAVSSYGGGPRIGGSTLTMQLARLLYGLNTRSVSGKLVQMARAVELEIRYSKRDLLEAHVNLVPYGGNVQGVGTASLIYFGKPASKLGLAEALTLVVIPQSPARRDPEAEEPLQLRAARERLFARWRARAERTPRVLTHMDVGNGAERRMRESSRLTSRDDAYEYVSLPLRYSLRTDLPFAAPHFTDLVLARERQAALVGLPRHAHANTLTTTLDLPLQRLTERVLQGYVREHGHIGIHNASAILVDYRDMSVRAMVGSADFRSAAIHGQVNGTVAKRSPGSALKPLIYGLAIDQGLIHPLSVLRDAPTAFGPFSPENFDGRFLGPVTATDALVRSRNVPAVALAAQLTQPTLYQFLKTAGVSQMASEQHYGLALALGGGEVTPEEVAALYAMLGNRGRLRPMRYFVNEPAAPGTRVLSEEASFMVLDMLKSGARPGDSSLRWNDGAGKRDRVRVAWKTGTSWGFRDAWTASVFGPYVLVVWVGNFDGHGNPALVGLQAAAPLLFRLTDAVATNAPQLTEPAFRQPARLERVDVCTASGELPNAECPQTTPTWYIPGVSPIRVSQIHRRIVVDARTGRQACPPYDATFTRSEVYEFWPTDLLQLFAQAGIPRRQPPAPSDCQRDVPTGTPPRITSPVLTATYSIRAQRVGAESIPLVANADSEVHRLHWFVDESYVGTGTPGIGLAWSPTHAGRFVVRTVDDRGRADSRELNVSIVR